MIRFHCPNCDRAYALPDALAQIPILCKGCGQRIDVPEPTPEPEPEPEAKRDFLEPHPVPPPPSFLPELDDADFPPENTPQEPEHQRDPKPVAPLPPPAPASGRKGAGIVVDVAVGLLLAIGGAVSGEVVVGPSLPQLMDGGGLVDGLVWSGCVVVPPLVYLLLANRGKSVGGWLRTRSG